MLLSSMASEHALPFAVLNIGPEMVYTFEQRSRAQQIAPKNSAQMPLLLT
jgi:hypothetical protein